MLEKLLFYDPQCWKPHFDYTLHDELKYLSSIFGIPINPSHKDNLLKIIINLRGLVSYVINDQDSTIYFDWYTLTKNNALQNYWYISQRYRLFFNCSTNHITLFEYNANAEDPIVVDDFTIDAFIAEMQKDITGNGPSIRPFIGFIKY